MSGHMRNINQLHYQLTVRDVDDAIDRRLRRVGTADKERVVREVLLPTVGLSRIECSGMGARKLVMEQRARDIDRQVRQQLLEKQAALMSAENLLAEEQLSATAGSSRFPSVEEFPSNFRLSMRKKQEGADNNNAGDAITIINGEDAPQQQHHSPAARRRASFTSPPETAVQSSAAMGPPPPNNRHGSVADNTPTQVRKREAWNDVPSSSSSVDQTPPENRDKQQQQQQQLQQRRNSTEQKNTNAVVAPSPLFQRVEPPRPESSGSMGTGTGSHTSLSSSGSRGTSNTVRSNATSMKSGSVITGTSTTDGGGGADDAPKQRARASKGRKRGEKLAVHDDSLWHHQEIKDMARSINDWFVELDHEFLLKPVHRPAESKVKAPAPVATSNYASVVETTRSMVETQTIEEPDEEEQQKDPAWQMRYEAFTPVNLEPILRKCRPAWALSKSTTSAFDAHEKKFNEMIARCSKILLNDEFEVKRAQTMESRRRTPVSPEEQHRRDVLKSRQRPNPLYVHDPAPPPTSTPMAVRQRTLTRQAEARKPRLLQHQPLISLIATCKSHSVRAAVSQPDNNAVQKSQSPHSRQRSVK